MPTLDDLLRETEDKDKKKGGLDALLRGTEQPKAKGLDALLAETGTARPTLTPTPFPATPPPGNIEQTAKQQILSKRDRERELLRAAQQVDSEALARKVQSGQPLTDVERRAWQEQSGRAIPTRELETAAVVGTSVLFPPLAVGPAALGTVGRTALGSGLVGSAENTAIELGSSIAERKLPDPAELAISAGTGFLGGAIGGAVASGVLGKTGENTFGRKVKDIADYHGTSPSQVNKYLKETAEQLGTDRGTIADEVIGHAVKTQPEGAQAFAKYLDEVAAPPGAVDDVASVFQAPQTRAAMGIEDVPVDTIYEQAVKSEIHDSLTKEATKVLKILPEQSDERVFQQITKLIENQEISLDRVRPLLDEMGIDHLAFARQYNQDVSRAGRVLAYHSRTSRQLAKHFQGTDAEEIFTVASKEGDDSVNRLWDFMSGSWHMVENVRRASIVTQLGTAARNLETQAARGGVEIWDTFTQGLLKGNPKAAVTESMTELMVLARRMKPVQKKAFMEALDAFPIEREKLFSAPVHEVAALDKYTKTINFFNRWQEFHSRRVGFQMRFARNLQRAGYDPFSVNMKDIPDDVLLPAVEDSVDFSLDMAFANGPKNILSKRVLDGYKAFPLLTTVNPFPRFNFANAWQYMWEFSPMGFTRLLQKSTREAIAAGNMEAISRATLGTIFTAAGYALRSSSFAGENWYDINVGKYTLDSRPFAPFNVYLFFGEMIKDVQRKANGEKAKLSFRDYALLPIGMTRVSGTGLVFADILSEKRTEVSWNLLQDFFAAYFGGFSVPGRTPLDIVGGIEQRLGMDPAEEALYRQQRGEGVTAPFRANVPGLSRTLPPVYSPFEEGPIEPVDPLLKQLTGLNLKNYTTLRKETDRLNMDYRSIYPATGIPEADNEISKYMGIIITNMGDPLSSATDVKGRTITPDMYKSLPEPAQRIILRQYFAEARKRSLELLQYTDPVLYQKVKIRKMDKDEAELLGIDRNNPFNE